MDAYVGIHVTLVHIISFSTRLLFQTKEIGNRYKSISAEEKAKWQSKADAAKEVYKKDVAEYEKTKVATKPKAKPESKKKKPDPASDSSEDSDDSESDADDSDDSDGDSD